MDLPPDDMHTISYVKTRCCVLYRKITTHGYSIRCRIRFRMLYLPWNLFSLLPGRVPAPCFSSFRAGPALYCAKEAVCAGMSLFFLELLDGLARGKRLQTVPDPIKGQAHPVAEIQTRDSSGRRGCTQLARKEQHLETVQNSVVVLGLLAILNPMRYSIPSHPRYIPHHIPFMLFTI